MCFISLFGLCKCGPLFPGMLFSLTLTPLMLRSVGRDIPGGPVAKALYFQCRGPRFDLCLGNKILHAATKSLHGETKDPT